MHSTETSPIEGHSIIDYINHCIADYLSGARLCPKTSRKVSRSTIARLTNLRYAIFRYAIQTTDTPTLENIDKNFLQSFILWNKERGLLPNSINNLTATLHKVMRLAYEEGETRNMCYRMSDFVTRKQEVDHIYLSPEQIQSMHELKLSSRSRIHKLIDACPSLSTTRKSEMKHYVTETVARHILQARDLFLVGCYTGQRFSDYSRMNNDMIVRLGGKDFIQIQQQKTAKRIYIPLDIRVKSILRKHGGTMPKDDIKRVNQNLRFIGELLGWTYRPQIDERRMGHKHGPRFCDMLTTHTARRSFATNAYAAGVPLSSIMAITGHSREEKLRTYLKLQVEDSALIAARDLATILQL